MVMHADKSTLGRRRFVFSFCVVCLPSLLFVGWTTIVHPNNALYNREGKLGKKNTPKCSMLIIMNGIFVDVWCGGEVEDDDDDCFFFTNYGTV